MVGRQSCKPVATNVSDLVKPFLRSQDQIQHIKTYRAYFVHWCHTWFVVCYLFFGHLVEECLCHSVPPRNAELQQKVPVRCINLVLGLTSKRKVPNHTAFRTSLYSQSCIEISDNKHLAQKDILAARLFPPWQKKSTKSANRLV